jgi:hypothetical protein
MYKNNYSSDYVDILKMKCTKTCAINNYPIDDDSIYLKITDAALTYLTITDAALTYLTITDAALTYLTITDASANYLKITDANANYLSRIGVATSNATSTSFNGGDIFIQGIRAGVGNYQSTTTNTCFGYGALAATTGAGINNCGFGNNALQTTTDGNKNCAFGVGTLRQITTGVRNTCVGYVAGQGLNLGSNDNTFIGNDAGTDVTGVNTGNTFIGSSSGRTSLTGTITNVTALGFGATSNHSTSTVIGYLAAATADNQIMLGRATEFVDCPGTTASGSLITAADIYINGVRAGVGLFKSGTDVSGNTAFGRNALVATTTATNSCGVGNGALSALTTGEGNTAVGTLALNAVSTTSRNTAVGSACLKFATSGNHNTGIGNGSGQTVTTGSDNTVCGYIAGGSITTGSFNTCLGSGANVTSGGVANSTALGAYSSVAGFSNSTAIGGGTNITLGAVCTAAHQIMLGTTAEHVVCPGGIQLQPTITPQLSSSSGSLTIPLGSIVSFSSFTLTMTENITAFTITGGVSGYSEYTVFITGDSSSSFTFNTTSSLTIKQNWTGPQTIVANTYAILSIRHNSTINYLKLDTYS